MSKHTISSIKKGRIHLRLLEESDLPMTLKWRNQDHIRKWFIHSEVLSINQHQEWFDGYLQRDNDYLFIIEETRDVNKPVGQLSLYNIDWASNCAEYGRLLIGEADARGKGIAQEASFLLLHYAFKELKLKEIELAVSNDNKPAIAVYRACGFQEVPEDSRLNGLKKMVITGNDFRLRQITTCLGP
jgi:RimJ/RimL family protein N-acetyltransferase